MYAPYEEQEIQELKAAIQRVRELADELSKYPNFLEQEIAKDIIKALDGEQ